MAEVFLTVEENNNSRDSRKKTTKKKRQEKKPLLAGYRPKHQIRGLLSHCILFFHPPSVDALTTELLGDSWQA